VSSVGVLIKQVKKKSLMTFFFAFAPVSDPPMMGD